MPGSAATLATGTAESPLAKPPGTGPGWIVAATVIGTTIEWYDFFIYGTTGTTPFLKTIDRVANPPRK